MTAYLHHIFFDPLSTWETLKVELIVLPVALIMFLAIATFMRRKR